MKSGETNEVEETAAVSINAIEEEVTTTVASEEVGIIEKKEETEQKGEEQEGSDSEELDEKTIRREERKYRGLAAYLSLLRNSSPTADDGVGEGTSAASGEAEISTGVTEIVEESANIDMSQLSRKERRALMFKNRKYVREPEEKEDEPIPMKIPRIEVTYDLENTPQTSAFCNKESFSSSKKSTFGFGQVNFLNNYVKSTKFSPCGKFVSTTSQDHSARIFKFDSEENKMSLLCSIPCGDLIYDSAFHPCGDLLATTARLHPIHIWDTQGERLATYRGINHLDELAAAQTICFSIDGSRMYAGYKKMIRVWDVKRPGPQVLDIPTWTKEWGGQRAIISTIAMHPLLDGQYAAGCYGPSIALYSDRTNSVDCIFSGEFTASTHLQFSSDGRLLFNACRRNKHICCWDMRNPGKLLYKLVRPMDTNHKAAFDIDGLNRYLFSGTSDGQLVAFDLKDEKDEKQPIWTRKAADCCVPAVSLHPSLPLLTACTGERVFPRPKDKLIAIDGCSDSSDEENPLVIDSRKYRSTASFDELFNSVQLWKLD